MAFRWTDWSWEPGIVAPLALSLWLYVRGALRLRRRAPGADGIRRWRVWCFAVGWTITALALVSPLHEWSEQLFSAHMIQHELLMVLAAPLLVLGRPLVPMVWGVERPLRPWIGSVARVRAVRRTWRAMTTPFAAWLLFAAAVWIWHAPPLFQATLASEVVHAAQHASFFFTALLFWWALLDDRPGRPTGGAGVLYVFTTAAHTGALGALITFSRVAWYPTYGASTVRWGLTPLEDQQLAGLIMWIPGSLPLLAACLWLFARWIQASDASSSAVAAPAAARVG